MKPHRATRAAVALQRLATTLGLALLAALVLPLGEAHAKVQCSSLFDRDPAANTYFVLLLLDPIAGVDGAQRAQLHEQLVNAFALQLGGIAAKVQENSGARKRLRLEPVACEHHVVLNDLGREEMSDFSGAKVVAVLWKGREGNKASLVQLAVPVYLRSEGAARREAEVVTAYVDNPADPIQGWIDTLTRNNGELHRPFVTMGLASAYQREKELVAAWAALCQSRSSLALLPDPLHPADRKLLTREIDAPLLKAMNELEQAVQKSGGGPLPPCTLPR